MNINPNINVQSFGRAFTTQEKKSYTRLLKDSKSELGIQDTSAIIFDFNVPSPIGKNTAIGSSWSDNMHFFIQFLKDMTGITSIQMQPEGEIARGNTSAYSGTNYALGRHIIDLDKLTQKKYGSLLTQEYVKSLDDNYWGDKNQREYRTDYSYVLGTDDNNGIQEKALFLAYENFKKGIIEKKPEILNLEKDFNEYKKDNSFWLEKEVLFNVLAKQYRTNDFNKWSDLDKNLYSSKCSNKEREDRIREIKETYPNEIDFEMFVQFIADKEQKESRRYLNSQNIKLYGDCLIGFSPSEIWANKDCFRENLYYGGPDPNCSETNNIQTWGLNALDYTKLGECTDDGDLSKLKEVGRCLYDKYTIFFKRYDGLRMDAAWQFVTPFIYQAINGTYEEVKMPQIDFTIFNIMKAAAKNVLKDKFDEQNPDNIMLELVGISAGKSREMTLNKYPHLYTTAYAEYDETPKKFFEKGYQNGKFYTGVGCHDNDSLNNLARDSHKRKLHLDGMQRDYNLNMADLKFKSEEYSKMSDEERKQEDFRTAKFAEIYTSAKQFFTLPDMFGMSERINISGKYSENNWTVRIPTDYERFYFSQLSNGFGLNIPKVFSVAMRMKEGAKNEQLIEKCQEAAEILRQKGPMTEEEANKWQEEGKLTNKFEYVA